MANSDYLKANRRGSRDAELENDGGFKSVTKKHKSLKDFKRRPKHKNGWGSDEY